KHRRFVNEHITPCTVKDVHVNAGSTNHSLKGDLSIKRRSYSITLVIVTVALILSAAVFSKAQNREKFVISAKAGGVNAISGRTEVRSKHGGEWQLLSITDNLKTGDVVKTGVDGRLEMLLNPGSYLRVGENSEFELKNDSLDGLEVRLNQGTAIVEATGANGIELQ